MRLPLKVSKQSENGPVRTYRRNMRLPLKVSKQSENGPVRTDRRNMRLPLKVSKQSGNGPVKMTKIPAIAAVHGPHSLVRFGD